MTHPGRVVWSEGMFLHPQHFQQQDRWVEGLVRAAAHGLRHHGWGFDGLELDRGLLAQGKVAIRRASGVMPDGTAFAIPDGCPAPEPIEVGGAAAQAVVHLALAATPAGSAEIDPPEAEPAGGARYAAREIEVRDNITPADGSVALHVAEPRFRLLSGSARLDAYVHLPVARVSAVLPDGTLDLDKEFPIPCLGFGASGYLFKVVGDLAGDLERVARRRAPYVTEKRAQGVGDPTDLMVLQLCNRYLAGARHLAAQRAAHPEDLYRWVLEFLGEASSFTEGDRVAPAVKPPYRHAEPWLAFPPLVAAVRLVLDKLLRPERKAVQIPLKVFPDGVRAALVQDVSLFTEASFYLAVRANAPPDTIRGNFPGQTTIGPHEELQRLVDAAVSGIELRHVPHVPDEIPVRRQMVYFDFDQKSDLWRKLPGSRALTIHVAGSLRDGLDMECWAVRG